MRGAELSQQRVAAEWPRISVVTPSFNQGRYIGETIESVIGQGYPNLEYIIVDGGSTDETVATVSRYREQISHFISEPDRGQSHALNKGFALATGDILCWLNSDDQFAPGALVSVALAFRVYQPDLVAGICEVFEDGERVHRHLTSCANGPLPLNDLLDLDKGWNAGQFFYQPEVFFSRDLWRRAGGQVREDVHFSMDYELWCRFALNQARLRVLGTPLALFRSHSDQKTTDISGFKRELISVRDEFCARFGLDRAGSARPRVDWTKKLRIALVNDLGFLYGAGIAHWRLAAALDLAGHAVESFPLVRAAAGAGGYPRLMKAIGRFKPDLVLLGNFHAVEKKSVQLLAELESRWPCFWVTHDFWLLTGRCPYMGGCEKYLAGCDEQCPTADDYPALAPVEIRPAWQAKRDLLARAHQLKLLANSDWAAERSRQALRQVSGTRVAVDRISLGFPVEIFDSIDRELARLEFGIAEHEMCLAFSSSSISDPRKGSALLAAALGRLDPGDLVVLLIGRVDRTLDLGEIRTIYTGFIDDPRKVARALAAADLYVAPSLEETFGQVFVEAALAGTPSVGFSVSGVAEAIVDGITGFLVDDISAESLGDCLARLLADPETLRRVAYTAPFHARAQFSLEACQHSLFQAFDRAGLVDGCRVPHKISLAERSRFIEAPGLAEEEPGTGTLLLKIPRLASQWFVGLLPQDFKDRLRHRLPTWLDRWLVRFIFGPNG